MTSQQTLQPPAQDGVAGAHSIQESYTLGGVVHFQGLGEEGLLVHHQGFHAVVKFSFYPFMRRSTTSCAQKNQSRDRRANGRR
jgi:hypothetical protein